MELFINDVVKVKLNEKGLSVLKNRWKKRQKVYPKIGPWIKPKIDEKGYTRFSLWSFMETFGSEMYLGNPEIPFEEPIIKVLNRPKFCTNCGLKI